MKAGARFKVGEKVGKWTIDRKAPDLFYPSSKYGEPQWHCVCECGHKKIVPRMTLRSIRKSKNVTGCIKCKGFQHGMCFTPQYRFCLSARYRAKKSGVPFSITWKDIELPTHCPLLGIPLVYRASTRLAKTNGKRNWNTATLDRIVPSKGYVLGNIWVVSHKANLTKAQLSLEELEMLTANLRKKIQRKAIS